MAEKAAAAVLVKSSGTFEGAGGRVRGLDFEETNDEPTVANLVASMRSTGFQATNVALACDEINRMLAWSETEDAARIRCGEGATAIPARCTIFLSFTSNMVSCGLRETIKFLVKHKLVDVLVTSAGGIEEDLIKCFADTVLGDFKLNGRELRSKGMNRLGNLIIPNANYCLFEDWVSPILHAMTDEQATGTRWSPSLVIKRLGLEINNEDSYLYWAAKNDIPVFCPALTDGSLGDMMYFHSYRRPEFMLDIVQDIRFINDIAMRAACTGMVVLGGILIVFRY